MLKSEVCLCDKICNKKNKEDSEIWKKNKTNTENFFTILDNFFIILFCFHK
jgi:hypothetical protein